MIASLVAIGCFYSTSIGDSILSSTLSTLMITVGLFYSGYWAGWDSILSRDSCFCISSLSGDVGGTNYLIAGGAPKPAVSVALRGELTLLPASLISISGCPRCLFVSGLLILLKSTSVGY